MFEPLSEQEFDELDRLLLSDEMPESCMDVVTLEGFLTAIVIGPVTLSPTAWLPRIWGGENLEKAPQFPSLEGLDRLVDLVMRLYNEVVSLFEADPAAFSPTFYERTVEGKTYTIVDEWCDGFLQGVQLAQEAWRPMLNSDPGMFKPFELFATPEGWAELDASADEEAMHREWSNKIAPTVIAIHAYWLPYRRALSEELSSEPNHRAGIPPVAKVGRNDPCPCGSGRKYKKCCGEPQTLH